MLLSCRMVPKSLTYLNTWKQKGCVESYEKNKIDHLNALKTVCLFRWSLKGLVKGTLYLKHIRDPKNAYCYKKRDFLKQLLNLIFPVPLIFSLLSHLPNLFSLNSLVFFRDFSCGLMGKHKSFCHSPLFLTWEQNKIINGRGWL